MNRDIVFGLFAGGVAWAWLVLMIVTSEIAENRTLGVHTWPLIAVALAPPAAAISLGVWTWIRGVK